MDAEHDALLSDVEAFLSLFDMTPTKFGRDAIGDPQFVFDLREGRECRRATRTKVAEFIKAQKEEARRRSEAA